MQATATIQANAIRDLVRSQMTPAARAEARKAWDSLWRELPAVARRDRVKGECARLAFLDALSVGRDLGQACDAARARIERESAI